MAGYKSYQAEGAKYAVEVSRKMKLELFVTVKKWISHHFGIHSGFGP